jgi:hypothetical protein
MNDPRRKDKGTASKDLGLMYLFFAKKPEIRSYDCSENLTVTEQA